MTEGLLPAERADGRDSPRPRVDPAVSGALSVWFGSRLAVVVLAVVAAWLVRDTGGRDVGGFVELWNRWDVDQFRKVAEFGYFSPQYQDRTEAFFPGMPAALRLVHLVVPDLYACGLLVSFVAGGFASVGLWRLAEAESGPVAGRRAVVYLALFPYAVFLFAGYSEALFLAFAVNAWHAARNDRWWLAGVLGAGAAATRITGVVLGAGLAVLYVEQALRRRPAGTGVLRAALRPQLGWLALPALPVVAYFGYLHRRTGHWDAYAIALKEGWGRDTVSPLRALQTTLASARDLDQGAAYVWSWRAELLSMAVGVVLTLVLLRRQRFGEATYVGLNVALLSTSTYYASTVRALMVWFPLYLLLARTTVRRDWLHDLLVWVSAPLAAGITIAFVKGAWLG